MDPNLERGIARPVFNARNHLNNFLEHIDDIRDDSSEASQKFIVVGFELSEIVAATWYFLLELSIGLLMYVSVGLIYLSRLLPLSGNSTSQAL